jgi:hypothetical protein
VKASNRAPYSKLMLCKAIFKLQFPSGHRKEGSEHSQNQCERISSRGASSSTATQELIFWQRFVLPLNFPIEFICPIQKLFSNERRAGGQLLLFCKPKVIHLILAWNFEIKKWL